MRDGSAASDTGTEALMFSFLNQIKPWRVASLGLISTFAFIGASASGADAALIKTSACNENALTQPFTPWGDSSSYELAPDGNFEAPLSGWTLSGAAARVEGGTSYSSAGLASSHSLSVPAGSSAQTPSSCVDAAYPTFRFLATSSAGATMLVEDVYSTLLGQVAVPIQVLIIPSDWQPTPAGLTASIATGLLSGGTAQMSLRFVTLTGSARIDDVYIDPRMVR
jgi:hypothetical protein